MDTPIFVKTYDWSLWLFQKTSGFPKRFRHTLTHRLEADTLEIESVLTRANRHRGSDRARLLDEADALLDCLRINVRRCYDLKCLAANGYEFAAKALNEIGRLLGAWQNATVRQLS